MIKLGIRILRFPSYLVFTNIEYVLQQITNEIELTKSLHPKVFDRFKKKQPKIKDVVDNQSGEILN